MDAHGPPPTVVDGGFGVTFNDITKDTDFKFVLLPHTLWLGLVPFFRNVRVCGCPRMTSKTHPRGLRPRLRSSVTSQFLGKYDYKIVAVQCPDSVPPRTQPATV
jgi:hypothetical protein